MAAVLAATDGKSAIDILTPGQTCENVTVTLFPTYNASSPCGTTGTSISMFLERERCYALEAAAISIPISPEDSAITLSPGSNDCAGPVQNFPMEAGHGIMCLILTNEDGTPHSPLSGYWTCMAG